MDTLHGITGAFNNFNITHKLKLTNKPYKQKKASRIRMPKLYFKNNTYFLLVPKSITIGVDIHNDE